MRNITFLLFSIACITPFCSGMHQTQKTPPGSPRSEEAEEWETPDGFNNQSPLNASTQSVYGTSHEENPTESDDTVIVLFPEVIIDSDGVPGTSTNPSSTAPESPAGLPVIDPANPDTSINSGPSDAATIGALQQLQNSKLNQGTLVSAGFPGMHPQGSVNDPLLQHKKKTKTNLDNVSLKDEEASKKCCTLL